MEKIPVKLANTPYNIFINDKFTSIKKTTDSLSLGNFTLIVTSKSVFSLHKKRIDQAFSHIEHKILTLPDGEEAKTAKNLFKIINTLLTVNKPGRSAFITAIGGGTIGDVVGFAAGIYKRGTDYIQIPTTFLAQIDSSIGGKTAIDLPQAKNIIGVFHHPRAVIIDISFLKTLPKRELRQGMSEAIKYAAICDNRLFEFLKNNTEKILHLDRPAMIYIIRRCAAIKAGLVAKDEKEKRGLRTILNFGHTLGHALESSLNYTGLTHGEAVAIGMVYAVRLSAHLGLCDQNTVKDLVSLIKDYSLPVNIKLNSSATIKALMHDKKFISGTIRMVLLHSIGKATVVNNIDADIIKSSLTCIEQK